MDVQQPPGDDQPDSTAAFLIRELCTRIDTARVYLTHVTANDTANVCTRLADVATCEIVIFEQLVDDGPAHRDAPVVLVRADAYGQRVGGPELHTHRITLPNSAGRANPCEYSTYGFMWTGCRQRRSAIIAISLKEHSERHLEQTPP
ncbi:MAG TPA: hypothetical protein VGD56_13995 [Gemmatirosa sp.]